VSSFQGKIRDYDPSTDTASVELVHHGIIESWLTGVKIHPAVNRAFVVHGADVDVALNDENRWDEALITGSGSNVNAVGSSGSSGTITTQTGRAVIGTGAGGAGSASISFSPAFTGTPTLTTSFDNQYTVVIGGLTNAGATISVTGGPTNANVYCSWEAQGH
jgi:hypothetical protein